MGSLKSDTHIYRLCNTKDYNHFTIDKNEKATLFSLGEKSEGVAFYSDGDRVIYRMCTPKSGALF